MEGAFPTVFWFIKLAAVTEPEGVAVAIADALGVQDAAAEPLLQTLTGVSAHKQTLIIIDNASTSALLAPQRSPRS